MLVPGSGSVWRHQASCASRATSYRHCVSHNSFPPDRAFTDQPKAGKRVCVTWHEHANRYTADADARSPAIANVINDADKMAAASALIISRLSGDFFKVRFLFATEIVRGHFRYLS